jgi:hypothetical protein
MFIGLQWVNMMSGKLPGWIHTFLLRPSSGSLMLQSFSETFFSLIPSSWFSAGIPVL